MKIPLGMALTILLLAPACTQKTPDTTQAGSDERANVTEQMKRDRDDYVTAMNAKLAEFDQKFDGLDERAAAMKGTAMDTFQDAVTRLRDQRKAVAAKLDDLKAVNVESWQPLRGEVDSAMAELERSYEQVSSSFEKAPARKTS